MSLFDVTPTRLRIPFSRFCRNSLYRGGGLGVIRKEARPFYRTISGVRLCLELEEPNLLPLAARREPSALEGWILEVLHCNLKGKRAFLWILFTERRGVRLCWALSKPEGPKGRSRLKQPNPENETRNSKDIPRNTRHETRNTRPKTRDLKPTAPQPKTKQTG